MTGPRRSSVLSRLAIVGVLLGAIVTVVINPQASAAVGDITVFAGAGPNGYAGDGGPAPAALLNGPGDVAVDAAGNTYIADTQNNVIRRVDPGGTITTVVGTGTSGFSGDGGPPLSAQLDGPSSITVDQLGNLLISDTNNFRIRYVNFSAVAVTVYGVTVQPNTIRTVAGLGTPGFNGDNQPATSAQLNTPGGIDVDPAGNLFIADQSNFRIRRVDRATGTITTVAGNGNSGFSGDGGPATAAQIIPLDVAVDSLGNVIIACGDNRRVRYVNLTGGSVTAYGVTVAPGAIATVAGNGAPGSGGDGGPATAAQLAFPLGVDVDSANNLYIADDGASRRVRRVDRGTGIITTVAGTGANGAGPYGGPATAAALTGPVTVTFDNQGNLLIVDASPNNRVLKVEGIGPSPPTTTPPTTAPPTTVPPTTAPPTTVPPTTAPPTTVPPTTAPPTTVPPTTAPPTTVPPTTAPPTTVPPTTAPPTTVPPTTAPPTTAPPTTTPPTTAPPTTAPPTTTPPTTGAPGTCDGRTATITGTAGNDRIFGTPGPDVILGGGGNDEIHGLGGDDVICGGAGNDRLLGGDGNDRLFGDDGTDQLFGGNGNDLVNGGPGIPDACYGDEGTDSAAACEQIVGVP